MKNSKGFVQIIVVVLVVLATLVGVYYFGTIKNKTVSTPTNSVQPSSSPSTSLLPSPSPVSEPTNGPISSWKSYTIKIVGLTFKLPPELAPTSGNMTIQTIPGEKGISFIASSDKTSNFKIGTTSVDFEAGREGTFLDLQGYSFANGKYSANFVLGQSFILPNELIKEVNGDGLKLLEITGKDHTSGEYLGPIEGTPGDGSIGALINIPNNKTYRGVAVEMNLSDNLTVRLFDQILSTFKFTN